MDIKMNLNNNMYKNINIRKEDDQSIMTELVPTMDCLFGENYQDSEFRDKFTQVNNLIDFARNKIKREYILCYNGNCNRNELIEYIMESLDCPLNILEFGPFTARNRKYVENFCYDIQIITAICIHDKEKMLLLRNSKQSSYYNSGTISYVQGHVEYSSRDKELNLSELLINNMLKEINEEIGITSGNLPSELLGPKTVIYLPTLPSTIKHVCVLYETEVDDVNDFFCKEDDKEIVTIRFDQIHTIYNQLCPWVLHSLSKFDYIKDAYLKYLEKIRY